MTPTALVTVEGGIASVETFGPVYPMIYDYDGLDGEDEDNELSDADKAMIALEHPDRPTVIVEVTDGVAAIDVVGPNAEAVEVYKIDWDVLDGDGADPGDDYPQEMLALLSEAEAIPAEVKDPLLARIQAEIDARAELDD